MTTLRGLVLSLTVLAFIAAPALALEKSGRVEMEEAAAPEIDGVVYLNEGMGVAGDFAKVEITDAAAYDLVGRIVG